MTDSAATRAAIRAGHYNKPTSGLAPGFVQANIVIMPADQADHFAEFCALNSRACPLLARSAPGDPALPKLGQDIDIRHDLPRYRVYRDGRLMDEPTAVAGLWRDDLVTFAIGCSFTFEHALLDAGMVLRHVGMGRNVAMYRSSVPTTEVGPFGGRTVMSMRPFAARDVARAIEISGRFPDMHGAPVHIGDPAIIGIDDLDAPDFGDAVPIHPGEVPLFWACGVTSQTAVQQARLPFFLAHAPGCMLITDLPHHLYDLSCSAGIAD